jgi:hypothetical protein
LVPEDQVHEDGPIISVERNGMGKTFLAQNLILGLLAILCG